MSPRPGYKPEGEGRDLWRDIPGYDGKYQVSRDGEVRRVIRPGYVRNLKPSRRTNPGALRRNKNSVVVKLTKDGKTRGHKAAKLVALAFLPPPPPGMALYHKNFILSDNRLSNLAYIDRKTLGAISGYHTNNRRPVVKINRTGEVVEVYRSARAAGAANHMSYQTVLDRCNNKVKNPWALDGHNYQWDE